MYVHENVCIHAYVHSHVHSHKHNATLYDSKTRWTISLTGRNQTRNSQNTYNMIPHLQFFFYRQNGPLLKETYFFNKIRKKCVRMIITNSESQNGGALLEAKRRKEAKKVIQGVSMMFGV